MRKQADVDSKITPLQLVCQANTFTLAGTETTANALAFTMYLLARNPGAEAKLVEEIDLLAEQVAAEGKLGLQEVSLEDLAQLKYTEACFKETLRLFPTAPVTGRDTGPHPLTVRYGDEKEITIPADTSVLISIDSIHKDPDLWPEPEVFKPERFLDEAQSSIQSSYVPFGFGSRTCVGNRFALMEAKLALARLYHDFKFTLAPGQETMEVSTGITLAPRHGVRMIVAPRRA